MSSDFPQSQMTSTITLPNLLSISSWPYESTVNSHRHSVALESQQWTESFQILTPKARAAFLRYDFPLLASLAYPLIGRRHLRLASDLMYWLFLYDELIGTQNGESARELTDLVLAVLRCPSQPLPAGAAVIGDMTRDLWSRFLAFSVPSSAARLQKSLEDYIEGVYIETLDREAGYINASVAECLASRRSTTASRAMINVLTLRVEIPESVISHPQIFSLTENGMDLICIHKDICSYNVQHSRNTQAHNLLTAVLNREALNMQNTVDYCGQLFCQKARSFLDNLPTTPSFSSDIEQTLHLHTDGIGRLVAGLDAWSSFRSQRFLGNSGHIVKKNSRINLTSELQHFETDMEMAYLSQDNGFDQVQDSMDQFLPE
ncbi:isoprenoid synthase domain-containing protein [Hysterangium stoloniferum]|nr:isoprenoid synthase domain-containing protein [Hysterangium stoloniferum]